MLVGSAGQACTMAILAAVSAYPENTKCGIAAAVFLFVFNSFFAFGWLGMTWLYPVSILVKN